MKIFVTDFGQVDPLSTAWLGLRSSLTYFSHLLLPMTGCCSSQRAHEQEICTSGPAGKYLELNLNTHLLRSDAPPCNQVIFLFLIDSFHHDFTVSLLFLFQLLHV
ncbi:hypothetical protein BHM03_00036343 [Ensete ventricosum]|nr:hypothetical protein BHM03_00036343 [Ensete ventricosum]